jgi:fructosamine-3-kinase
MNDWQQIANDISRAAGHPFNPGAPQALSGGCINRAQRLVDGDRSYFVKTNSANQQAMFEAEFNGLLDLAEAKAIRIPRPIATGISGDMAWLALEYIDLSGSGDASQAGEQLARMHQTTANQFGWRMDNTIGSTHQPNPRTSSWVDFWRDQRLGFQLRLAADRGHGGQLQQRGERLMVEFAALIDHAPEPSILHGDLWGGNFAYSRDGEPVLFDPAVYFGDAEADLAMTELFGGFGRAFYQAYASIRPLDPGYRTRKTLYNLYHILNHLNLFGGGYGSQASSMIDQLLAELGH